LDTAAISWGHPPAGDISSGGPLSRTVVIVFAFAVVRPPPSTSSPSSPDIVRLPSSATTAAEDMDRPASSRHSAGDFLASTARSRRLGNGGGDVDVDVDVVPFLPPSPRVLPPVVASSAVRRAIIDVGVDVDVGRGRSGRRRGNEEVAMIVVVVEGGGERKKACAIIVEGASWRCARKHAVATTTRVVDAEDGIIGPCW